MCVWCLFLGWGGGGGGGYGVGMGVGVKKKTCLTTVPSTPSHPWHWFHNLSPLSLPHFLLSSLQLLLAQCVWKEHKSDSGRPYFYNSETKESKWTTPKELEDLKEEIKKEEEEAKQR